MPRKKKVEAVEEEVVVPEESFDELPPGGTFIDIDEPATEEPVVEEPVEEDEDFRHIDLLVDQSVVNIWKRKGWTRPNNVLSAIKFDPIQMVSDEAVRSALFQCRKGLLSGGLLWVPKGWYNKELDGMEKSLYSELDEDYDAYIKP